MTRCMRALGRRILSTGVLAGLAAAIAAQPAVAGSAIARVEIHDRTAQSTLPVHRRFGQRWIAGEHGHEYAIRIRNQTSSRVLAVVSVDGVNAITGETAAFSQPGHVIEPGDEVTVDGWRKDLGRTAAFVFTDPRDAYAARTGRPEDLGVIGVALFRERPYPALLARESESPARRDSAADSPRASAAGKPAPDRVRTEAHADAPAGSLGTGHGRSQHSPAQWTTFERAGERPDQIVTLRYESRAALVAMSVLPRERRPRPAPEPFPGAHGFVPDP